ncbi:MAG: class I SAM-dependent methyltransferase [Candidatus Kerfeldbacteria bacterium]|jgi:SAM-dependent methyltransferase
MYSEKNREIKYKKIEAVLKDYLGKSVKNFRILDLGSGSGLIGDYFSNDNRVSYADISDYRLKKDGNFYNIISGDVECQDSSFDIIISNMVIEHTGNHEKHINEIKRLLKDGGIAYFGSPNRIFPIEPHYKIPFVHYFPNKINYLIVKYLSKYIRFEAPLENIDLPCYINLKKSINTRFEVKEYSSYILNNPNKFNSQVKIFSGWPVWLLKNIQFFFPTNIFILKK